MKKLKNKTVFNIGTGRESRFFAKYGAKVTHMDIGSETVKELKKWSKKNQKDVFSFTSDIKDPDKSILSFLYSNFYSP